MVDDVPYSINHQISDKHSHQGCLGPARSVLLNIVIILYTYKRFYSVSFKKKFHYLSVRILSFYIFYIRLLITIVFISIV